MLLEVCIDCIESALAAEEGGAHRLEVCGGLSAGGITPSVGLIHQCVIRCTIPSMVMIRPHDGDFVYDDDDLSTMLRDIDVAKELGVHGVVLGALTSDRDVDVAAMEHLIQAAKPLQVTFHRAFDTVRDPLNALDALLELRVDRLLTSGQASTAEHGKKLIRQLVEQAGDRLSIIAGAGVNASNALALVQATGVRELHASASESRLMTNSVDRVRFGEASRITSVARVRELINALDL